jgi:hypothetical protein
LRQQLGRGFVGVAPIGFPIVTGLVIAYLLVLGPVDYLLVNRWLRRPLAAWITFPLIVAAFTTLAYGFGNWSHGPSTTRVNRLQLVDVDASTGEARGTAWSVVYSPEARRFNLAVKVQSPKLDTSSSNDVLLCWWGLPGTGIGGMLAGGADWAIVSDGYEFGPDYASLKEVPILTSATKSLITRWTGKMPGTISSQLSDADGLVTGTVTNQTGAVLRNARLLYGSWAYRLGSMDVGERVEISEALSPRRAKTIVTRDALGESGANPSQAEGLVFSADRASPLEILSLMMFYETAGGYGFAHLPNRYQAYCDMSRQLELGRALLVAEGVDGGSQLIDEATAHELGDEEAGNSTTVYRFVLPVARPSGE